MDISKINAKYRAEMVAVFSKLADKVRAGELTPAQFLKAQQRVFAAYELASERVG